MANYIVQNRNDAAILSALQGLVADVTSFSWSAQAEPQFSASRNLTENERSILLEYFKRQDHLECA